MAGTTTEPPTPEKDVPQKPVTGASLRSVLFLQGLATPLFHRLACQLADAGHNVHRLCFNGGDRYLSAGRRPYRLHFFRGRHSDLNAYYKLLFAEAGIDTIVMFGDCRGIHMPAIEIAKATGIRVLVFEEGYIRPGWVTLEEDGTNHFSRMVGLGHLLPSLAEQARKRGADTKAAVPQGTSMARRIRWEVAQIAATFFTKPFFPHYRTHRPTTPLMEVGGWFKRFTRLAMGAGRRYAAILERYEREQPAFFLVPLQLNSDFQIRIHSPYPDVPTFIDEVITSFARHAPADCRLLIKNHPLDYGLIDYDRIIAEAAAREGVADRVDFVSGGDLVTMLRRSRGVVLVNSSVGYAALGEGAALKVMGRAIYDMPGLSNPAPLDAFWSSPQRPDPAVRDDFLTVVRAYTQLPGDFFSAGGIELALAAAYEVIVGSRPRLPALPAETGQPATSHPATTQKARSE